MLRHPIDNGVHNLELTKRLGVVGGLERWQVQAAVNEFNWRTAMANSSFATFVLGMQVGTSGVGFAMLSPSAFSCLCRSCTKIWEWAQLRIREQRRRLIDLLIRQQLQRGKTPDLAAAIRCLRVRQR